MRNHFALLNESLRRVLTTLLMMIMFVYKNLPLVEVAPLVVLQVPLRAKAFITVDLRAGESLLGLVYQSVNLEALLIRQLGTAVPFLTYEGLGAFVQILVSIKTTLASEAPCAVFVCTYEKFWQIIFVLILCSDDIFHIPDLIFFTLIC